MWLAGFIIIIVLGIAFPRSRAVSIIQLCFLWVIYWYLEYPSDLANYNIVYNRILAGNVGSFFTYEPLFMVLMRLCARFGLGFKVLRAVIGTISLALMYKAVGRYTEKTAFVFSLFAVFPFLTMAWTIRAFIASAIVVNGFRYLTTDGNKIKYVITIFIASLFHYSSVFYLIFILIGKKLRVDRIVAALFIEAVVILMYLQNWLVPIVSAVIKSNKVLSWLNPGSLNHPSIIGFLLAASIFIATMLIGVYSDMAIRREILLNDSIPLFSGRVKQACLLMIMVLPFIMVTETFTRLLYGILPLVMCNCANMSFFEQDEGKMLDSLLRDVIPAAPGFEAGDLSGISLSVRTIKQNAALRAVLSLFWIMWICLYYNIIYRGTGYTIFEALLAA